jgi:hypothetical protein
VATAELSRRVEKVVAGRTRDAPASGQRRCGTQRVRRRVPRPPPATRRHASRTRTRVQAGTRIRHPGGRGAVRVQYESGTAMADARAGCFEQARSRDWATIGPEADHSPACHLGHGGLLTPASGPVRPSGRSHGRSASTKSCRHPERRSHRARAGVQPACRTALRRGGAGSAPRARGVTTAWLPARARRAHGR